MKKRFLLFLVPMFLLVSCRSASYTAGRIMEKIIADHPTLFVDTADYHSEAQKGQSAYLTPRLCSLLYDEGRGREIPEFARVKDYAVCLSKGLGGGEIHIFCMEDDADVGSMEKLLLRRAELLKRRSLYLFVPEAYESHLASAMVKSIGNYVLLLATSQNETVFSYISHLVS